MGIQLRRRRRKQILFGLLVSMLILLGMAWGLITSCSGRDPVSAGIILLDMVAGGRAPRLPPNAEVIVPESEKPDGYFRLSPDGHRMLYHSSDGWVVLNLKTSEKHPLNLWGLTIWPTWIDDRYIYSREMGTDYLERPRLVVDTQTWEVQSIEEFSEEEAARFEAAFAQAWAEQPRSSPYPKHYSPDGRYYYQDIEKKSPYKNHIVIFSQDGPVLNECKDWYIGSPVSRAAWAHDSSGVYLLIEDFRGMGVIGKVDSSMIIKLLVPTPTPEP